MTLTLTCILIGVGILFDTSILHDTSILYDTRILHDDHNSYWYIYNVWFCLYYYTAFRASMMQHQRTQSDSEAPCDVAKYISVVAVQCIESIKVYNV